MGANPTKKFSYVMTLEAKQPLQVRHNALESARRVAVAFLEGKLGKTGFFLRLNKFPHHVLRENPLASGAGADRLSTGMKMSFGKPIGIAAQVHEGDPLFEVRAENLADAKKALTYIKCKLPGSWRLVEKQQELVA